MLKSLLRDPLFCGVITLQIAVFSLLYGAGWGDSLPADALRDRWTGGSFKTGHAMPSLTAYDQSGSRQPLIINGTTRSLLLKSTCSCDDIQTVALLEAARVGGENPTLVLPFEHEEAVQVQKHLHWKGRVLRVRPGELYRLGLLQNRDLPMLLHINNQGAILGVTHE